MRTWKQGVVGLLTFAGGTVYVKCLKYPLAAFYAHHDNKTAEDEKPVLYAFLDLSVLQHIERTGYEALTKPEKSINGSFTFEHEEKIELLPKMHMETVSDELLTVFNQRKIERFDEITEKCEKILRQGGSGRLQS
jgi:hypothetical protein